MAGGSRPGRGSYGAIIELIASRGPLPRDVVEAEIAPTVHPGRAARAYKTRLELSRASHERIKISNRAPSHWKPHPNAVELGQRIVFRFALKGFIERGYLAYDRETGIVSPGPRWELAVAGYLKDHDSG